MYLNIGNDMAVREKSIIGIFDLDNTSTSQRTRRFLEKAEQEGPEKNSLLEKMTRFALRYKQLGR